MADSLRTVAGVVMLTALAVAPLDYGSTRPMPLETLTALVGTGAAAWLLAGAFARRWQLPPRPALAGILLVGIVGAAWIFVLTPPAVPAFTRQHYARVVARWPDSIVPRGLPLTLTWSLVALAGFIVLCDLAREAAWRRGVAAVVVVTGAAVAVLGLAENATHACRIYWESAPRMPGAFFGPFFHHTSAGAYLNTVWPVGLGLALAGLQRGGRTPRQRAAIQGALAGAILTFAAHAGHVSRLPQVIAVVLAVVFLFWTGAWTALARHRGLRWATGGAAVLLALALAGFGAARVGDIAARWRLLTVAGLHGGRPPVPPPPPAEWPRLMRDDLFVPSDHRQYPLGDRGAAYAAAFAAIRQRPWFGWGPGGWIAAAAANSRDPFVRTFFLYLQFTHEDLLQAAVEWGLIGAAGWVLLLPGGVAAALRRLGAHPARDFIGAGAAAALLAVLLQSLIDFPLQIPAVQLNAAALAALAWTVPAGPDPAGAPAPLPS